VHGLSIDTNFDDLQWPGSGHNAPPPCPIHRESEKKLDPFSFEHNFYNLYCPILTILSLLQTELSADKHVIEFDAIPVVCRCIIFRYEIHTLLHRNC